MRRLTCYTIPILARALWHYTHYKGALVHACVATVPGTVL
jgi:hypothetical protein